MLDRVDCPCIISTFAVLMTKADNHHFNGYRLLALLFFVFKLLFSHHFGLKLRGDKSFLLRLYAKYGVQSFLTPYLSVLCRQHGFLFHGFVVIIVVTLIHQHHQHIVRAVEVPVPQPRPKAVIAIYCFYFLVVRGVLEDAPDLLSSFFGKASFFTILSALSPRFVLCSMASPT